MPALARSVRPALRAGFRKPSGEEAAVRAPSVSSYGDSGVAAVLTMAQDVWAMATKSPKRPTCRVLSGVRRRHWRWLDGACDAAERETQRVLSQGLGRWQAWARTIVAAALMSCHTIVA